MATPEMILSELRAAWGPVLGDRLLGMYVHGSLVTGDFAAPRSDLDLLAVLDAGPDDDLLAELARLHSGLDRRHPRWAGRIEVEYVALSAVRDAAHGHTDRGHVIARISPGELLHLLPATTHRLVTWSAVRDHGRILLGPSPDALLPDIDARLVRAALLDHVRDWPAWVTSMTRPGAQAYAVLTVCRAVQRLRHGRQLSKRQAADQTTTAEPRWAHLIIWARDWWYEGGRDTDPGDTGAVRAFVTELCAIILASEDRTPPRS